MVYEGLHGDTYKSLQKLAKAYGISYATVRRRRIEGMSTQEILIKYSNKEIYEGLHKDKYSTISSLAKAYNINTATLQSRLKSGMSMQEALTNPIFGCDSIKEDHLGNRYNSMAEMCKKYNINVGTFMHRIDSGMSLEEALTTPAFISVIHRDGKVDNLDELCKKHNICRHTLRERMKRGMSLEEALKYKKEVIDHLGNVYKSCLEMCEHYNIDAKTFNGRIKRGWSVKDALTTKANENTESKYCMDHVGNKFNTIIEMCSYWGISPTTYYNGIKRGLKLEQILTIKAKHSKCIDCYDHKNNKFNSINEMCRYWGVPISAYRHRIASGMSLKDALTIPASRGIECSSGFGERFKSIKEMCNAYGSNLTSFYKRVSDHIETSVALVVKNDAVRLMYVGLDGKARYTLNRVKDTLYTARELIAKYRPDLLEAYDKYNPTGEYRPYQEKVQESGL